MTFNGVIKWALNLLIFVAEFIFLTFLYFHGVLHYIDLRNQKTFGEF